VCWPCRNEGGTRARTAHRAQLEAEDRVLRAVDRHPFIADLPQCEAGGADIGEVGQSDAHISSRGARTGKEVVRKTIHAVSRRNGRDW